MELNNNLTKGKWAEDDNGMPKFFIINEAIIEKLCILGENVEPCFEGAGIAAKFSFDGEYKETLFSMMKELQTALQEGGLTQMDENKNNPTVEEEVTEITETEEYKCGGGGGSSSGSGDKKKDKKDSPVPPKKEDDDESEDDEEDKKKKKFAKSEEDDEEKKCPDCGESMLKCKCKKKKYNLEEIPEYVELAKNYALLQKKCNEYEAELTPLREFKKTADRNEKQNMIDSFYMLSDEDKKDVIANIDTYSLNDIEAKLSIICVRNKVNFNLDDDKKQSKDPMVYSLGDNDNGNDDAPAWIKAVRNTAKNMN